MRLQGEKNQIQKETCADFSLRRCDALARRPSFQRARCEEVWEPCTFDSSLLFTPSAPRAALLPNASLMSAGEERRTGLNLQHQQLPERRNEWSPRWKDFSPGVTVMRVAVLTWNGGATEQGFLSCGSPPPLHSSPHMHSHQQVN